MALPVNGEAQGCQETKHNKQLGSQGHGCPDYSQNSIALYGIGGVACSLKHNPDEKDG
ncbi:hypothetical protein D3C73_1626090 [compost metagenome]